MKITTKNISSSTALSARVLIRLRLFVGLLTAFAGVSMVNAATVGVRIVDELGQPLSGAAVCFGTAANKEQFGSYITGVDGDIVLHDLPHVALILTISKEKYQGVEMHQPGRNWNLISEVMLLENGIGPVCKHDTFEVTDIKRGLEIQRLDVEKNRSFIKIGSQVTGEPSHYRVSQDKSFNGAKWLPYKKTVKYWGAVQGSLYFQVKRFTGMKKGWLEARSYVANVSVN
jgi:hypothetical protein